MFKLDLEKAEESEIKLPTSVGSTKKQESSRKTSTSALLTMPKPLTLCITTNCGKFFSSVQFSRSVMSDSLRPHEPQHAQASLSITNPQSPPKPMSTVSMMPSNHLILCCPLLLLPSIFPSIGVFSNESVLRIR